MNRRQFVNALRILPPAAKELAGMSAPKLVTQAPNTRSIPIIDTHIHLFDRTRPEGAPYPRDVQGGGEPPQGMIAMPGRYNAIVAPFGVATTRFRRTSTGTMPVVGATRERPAFSLVSASTQHATRIARQ
jgi:hypothetical protein